MTRRETMGQRTMREWVKAKKRIATMGIASALDAQDIGQPDTITTNGAKGEITFKMLSGALVRMKITIERGDA